MTDSIPELETKPIELGMHLIAEFVTAIMLITSGIGLLRFRAWGLNLYLISMGMLLYTLIMSSGYFAQLGDYAFVAMFAVLIVMALIFVILPFIKSDQFIT